VLRRALVGKLVDIPEDLRAPFPVLVAILRDGNFRRLCQANRGWRRAALKALRQKRGWSVSESLPDEQAAEWLKAQPRIDGIDQQERSHQVERSARSGGNIPGRSGAFIDRAVLRHVAVDRRPASAYLGHSRVYFPAPTRACSQIALETSLSSTYGPGCYEATDAADDVALDAVLLSNAARVRPVRLPCVARRRNVPCAVRCGDGDREIEADLRWPRRIKLPAGVTAAGQTSHPRGRGAPLSLPCSRATNWLDPFPRMISTNAAQATGALRSKPIPLYDFRRGHRKAIASTPSDTNLGARTLCVGPRAMCLRSNPFLEEWQPASAKIRSLPAAHLSDTGARCDQVGRQARELKAGATNRRGHGPLCAIQETPAPIG